jgi:AraC-like DNA-binding protein
MNIVELKEKNQHGTREFPIELYHPHGLMAPYHWHDECEFIYMNSGIACCRIGVDSFELKEGECAFVKAGALHSLSNDTGNVFDFYAVVFHSSIIFNDMDICRKYLSSKYIIKERFSPYNNTESYVIQTVKSLCNTYENKPFAFELKIKSYLYLILSHIFDHGLYQTENNYDNKKAAHKLEKVIKYIHSNYNKTISIDELAALSGYSTSHFTRFFKELTGKTPTEYINQQRIYSACGLLKRTNYSVLTISLECGFDNVGYFIKTFKKYTNDTPYQYKQKNYFN